MKYSINLLILATLLLFGAALCSDEYRNHRRETNVSESSLLKNNSESDPKALKQGTSSEEEFEEKVGLGLEAIVSIPIVSIIVLCCCCYWCYKCCCFSYQNTIPPYVIMNSNVRQSAPPPQIILQNVTIQP